MPVLVLYIMDTITIMVEEHYCELLVMHGAYVYKHILFLEICMLSLYI